MSDNAYLDLILGLIPRALSMLDRNCYSYTYGCFDRNFWHYKALIDFPSATYQQAVLALALLFKNDFAGNSYYKNKKIMGYAKAGMLFWKSVQNKDGSFNEWYPQEHSYVATAFTSYAISESYLLLAEQLGDIKEGVIEALAKAGRWLSKNYDYFAANHIAGAIAALYNIYLITQDESLRQAMRNNIKILLDNQSREGWFNEYGGADIGYLSVSIDFLAKYYQKSNDETIRQPLTKALDFIKYFIHPDGTSGGEYGSRNTKYLFLHGLTILSKEFKAAREILTFFNKRFDAKKIIIPQYLDDRYFIFFLLGNYLQAGLTQQEDYGCDYSFENASFLKIFNEAGLLSKRNQRYHLVINYKKGVIKIFTLNPQENKLIYDNAGYFGMTKDGAVLSSQWLNSYSKEEISCLDKDIFAIKTKQPFHYLKQGLPLVRLLIPFRIFNYTIGRIGFLNSLFNRRLKKTMIIKKKLAPVFLERRVEISEDKLIIEDKIFKDRRIKLKNFSILNDIACLDVPSSRYFIYSDILNQPLCKIKLNKCLKLNEDIYLVTEIEFTQNGPLIGLTLNGNKIKWE